MISQRSRQLKRIINNTFSSKTNKKEYLAIYGEGRFPELPKSSAPIQLVNAPNRFIKKEFKIIHNPIIKITKKTLEPKVKIQ